MKLSIAYDNEAKKGFISGWGFSCFIATGDDSVLFDTGWDGCVLLQNLKAFGISPKDVDKVVLSHQHWDHMGGLTALLNANHDLEVYVPVSFSKRLKDEISTRARLVEVIGRQDICHNIYTTGELGKDVKEQSMLLDSSSGLYVVTGCAHPGLTEIMGVASQFGKVVGIIGGLHGTTEYNLLADLDLIACCHCTAHKEEIRKRFPDAHMEIEAGSILEL
ncbi:MAG: MBL fold metallo-hydrolase [Methanosarcinaceae archaeon]|nr:MBL fold metallo-hydrolase [Methanosarcinaceae archaeon]